MSLELTRYKLKVQITKNIKIIIDREALAQVDNAYSGMMAQALTQEERKKQEQKRAEEQQRWHAEQRMQVLSALYS
eukprot:SAG31_NODE_1195_length_9445_cov_21.712711_4_plen_76_part_00